jgi:hypothetical protein
MTQTPNPANPPPDPDTAGDLHQILTRLNQAAYRLAQQAAQRAAVPEQLEAEAQALDQQLMALSPRLDAAPPADQAELVNTWTEARLDLDYILSGGSQPTSIRLHRFLAGLGQ